MTSIEIHLKDEAEQKEKEHLQQLSNLEQAKIEMECLFEEQERTAQRNAYDLQKTITSLQQTETQLQNKISVLENSLSQQPGTYL